MKTWEKLMRWATGHSQSTGFKQALPIRVSYLVVVYVKIIGHENSTRQTIVLFSHLMFRVFGGKIAMLDGVAQLWEHSPQLFCLVCKHLLEIGVLSPISTVKYFLREDNNNAIALSPFLWEVS